MIDSVESLACQFHRHSRSRRPSAFAELNSEINFDKNTAETRHLNQTFELVCKESSTTLPCNSTLARQRFARQRTFINIIVMYFGGIAFSPGVEGELLRSLSKS